jgi:hypothetical protein
MSPSKLWEGWKPPEELDCPRPRAVRLTGRGMASWLISVSLVAGGVALAVPFARESRLAEAQARRMLVEARETEAVVTGLRHLRGYGASYRFSVNGREYGGSGGVERRRWESLRIGSSIAVRYLASGPAANYPSGDPPGRIPLWFAFLMCGLVAGTGVVLPLKVRRQSRLLAGGLPAPALVTRCRRMYVDYGASQIWMYYEFAPPGGGTCGGHAEAAGREPEGSVVCVLYDPANPSRNATYPLGLVKVPAVR